MLDGKYTKCWMAYDRHSTADAGNKFTLERFALGPHFHFHFLNVMASLNLNRMLP